MWVFRICCLFSIDIKKNGVCCVVKATQCIYGIACVIAFGYSAVVFSVLLTRIKKKMGYAVLPNTLQSIRSTSIIVGNQHKNQNVATKYIASSC